MGLSGVNQQSLIEHLIHTMAEASQRLEACIARSCEQQEMLINTFKDDQLRFQDEVRPSLSFIRVHGSHHLFGGMSSGLGGKDEIEERDEGRPDGSGVESGRGGSNMGHTGMNGDDTKPEESVSEMVSNAIEKAFEAMRQSLKEFSMERQTLAMKKLGATELGAMKFGAGGEAMKVDKVEGSANRPRMASLELVVSPGMDPIFSPCIHPNLVGYDQLGKMIGLGGPGQMGIGFGVGYMATGSGGGPGGSYGGHGGICDDDGAGVNNGLTAKGFIELAGEISADIGKLDKEGMPSGSNNHNKHLVVPKVSAETVIQPIDFNICGGAQRLNNVGEFDIPNTNDPPLIQFESCSDVIAPLVDRAGNISQNIQPDIGQNGSGSSMSYTESECMKSCVKSGTPTKEKGVHLVETKGLRTVHETLSSYRSSAQIGQVQPGNNCTPGISSDLVSPDVYLSISNAQQFGWNNPAMEHLTGAEEFTKSFVKESVKNNTLQSLAEGDNDDVVNVVDGFLPLEIGNGDDLGKGIWLDGNGYGRGGSGGGPSGDFGRHCSTITSRLSVKHDKDVKDTFESRGQFVDGLKFTGGSNSMMTKSFIKDVTDMAHKHNVKFSTGDWAEHLLRRGPSGLKECLEEWKPKEYLEECKRLGFDTVELNMGSLGFPEETLLRFVRLIKSAGLKAKLKFPVAFEKSDIPKTGNRAYGSYVVPTPLTSEMIENMVLLINRAERCWAAEVTSYEVAMNDATKYLRHYSWKYMVVDEGHRLKNCKCKLLKELKHLLVENKLLLIGTPLQNNLAELWSLLNFILPDKFSLHEEFESWFDLCGKCNNKAGKEEVEETRQLQVVAKLHAILCPFLLRRMKEDVEHMLPHKKKIILYDTMTECQENFQEHLVNMTLENHLLETVDTCHILRIAVKCLLNELPRRQWRPGIFSENHSNAVQFLRRTKVAIVADSSASIK